MTYLIHGEEPTGAMIALVPQDTQTFALPDGEPNEALHITLKFLGDASDWDDATRQDLVDSVASLAMSTGPVPLTCSGVELYGEDSDALALEFDSSLANALHKLCHGITNDIDLKWPDYRPHLTLKYLNENEDLPDTSYLEKQFKDSTLVADTIRVAFGSDLYDFKLGEMSNIEDVLDMAASAIVAASVPPSKQPKRAQPNQLTEKEIEQRRQAALKSAEARRKKASAKLIEGNRGKDARTRAQREFTERSSIEDRVRQYQRQLTNPKLTRAQRVMLQTALDIELENQREIRIKKAEEARRVQNELVTARAEFARAQRLFDVDKMNTLRKTIEGLEKELEQTSMADEIVKINFSTKREMAQQNARAAAEARRDRERQTRELKAKQREREREQKRREAERDRMARKFFTGIARRKREQEAEQRKREREAKRKQREAERKDKKKKGKKKKDPPKNYLTPAEKRQLAG
jgi:hypothetical protein